MQQRQLMQKNLAKLLKQVDYKSCGSDVQDFQDPVNPFMKRVFQKKLRRSSVASQNINPNSSIHQQRYDQTKHLPHIQSLISKGHDCLQKYKKNAISKLSQLQQYKHKGINTKNSKNIEKQIIQKVQRTIQFIEQYLYKNNIENDKQKIMKNNSISHIENYQCVQNEQMQKSRAKTKQTERNEVKNKGLSGSMVSQSVNRQTGHAKTIYESVLEERRNKKIKRSRVV